MRLFGVSMVRNEADVIEAFVRHNLSVLDGLMVIDHGSQDGTSQILAALADEGLPLRIVNDGNHGFHQSEQLTRAARATLMRERADYVFPLDADEFLKVPSRKALEEALAKVPPDEHASIHWITYVPEFYDAVARPLRPADLHWRLREERHGTYKAIVGRAFLQPSQYLIDGSHLVDDPTNSKPPGHMRLSKEVIALAHCPVRSAAQLERKVVLGYEAHLATTPENDRHAFHWRDLYGEIRAGRALTAERLEEIAANYGLPREKWLPLAKIDLVEDPVKMNLRLRYEGMQRLDAPISALRAATETRVQRAQ
jgi:hypothetical protein